MESEQDLTLLEVEAALRQIVAMKAAGMDDLHPRLVKNLRTKAIDSDDICLISLSRTRWFRRHGGRRISCHPQKWQAGNGDSFLRKMARSVVGKQAFHIAEGGGSTLEAYP